MVVLPTPPLPVTKSRRRSRSSVMSGPSASDPGELSAEPDATIVGRGADLDVGQLGRRHAHLPTLAVGEPERAAVGDGCLALLLHGVRVGSLLELNLELLVGLGTADADVHTAEEPRGGQELGSTCS